MVEANGYLIDSDILITMLRDRTDKTGLRSKALQVGLENCFVSAVSLSELYSGAYKMQSDRGLHEVDFIKKIFNILPYGDVDNVAEEVFGSTKAILSSSGRPLDDMDLLIGASAISRGLTMVTHNSRHFSRIPKLIVEDWLE